MNDDRVWVRSLHVIVGIIIYVLVTGAIFYMIKEREAAVWLHIAREGALQIVIIVLLTFISSMRKRMRNRKMYATAY